MKIRFFFSLFSLTAVLLTLLDIDLRSADNYSNYQWPTDASRTLTTVFGEMRPRRYHAGLDIRTYGRNGYEVYAISNGYIQRLRTGSSGYGKALYLQLTDGNTAVYAHLESFMPAMNDLARDIQEEAGSYTIDHYFEANRFPVKRGELIGYTGDTGSIGGPHLHFEVRDASENPMNPMMLGLQIPDKAPPIAEALAVIPRSPQTRVDASCLTQVYTVSAAGRSRYELTDTVQVYGDFGLAAQITDKIDGQPFDFSIHKLRLMVNDTLVYSLQYDRFQWHENLQVYAERDYGLWVTGQGEFHRLFTSDANQYLSFVRYENPAAVHWQTGLHNILVAAEDFNGNECRITGMIRILDQPPAVDAVPRGYLPDPHQPVQFEPASHGLVLSLSAPLERPDPDWVVIGDLKSPFRAQMALDYEHLPKPMKVHLQWDDPVSDDWTTSIRGDVLPVGEPFHFQQDGVLVESDGSTFWQTAFVPVMHTDATDFTFPNDLHIQSPVYFVGPDQLPFRKALQVTYFPESSEFPEHSSLFYLDRKKEQWYCLESERLENGALKTDILSAEFLAVFSETVPPQISRFQPKKGTVLEMDEKLLISFDVLDELSGLDGESDVIISLDGRKVIHEFNSYRKQCRFETRRPLSPGEHSIEVTAMDRVGNIRRFSRLITVTDRIPPTD